MPRTDHEPAADRQPSAQSQADATAAVALGRIDEESPFDRDGRLPAGAGRLVMELEPLSLGRALTSLVRHAATLPAIEGARAADDIAALIDERQRRKRAPAELQVRALVEIYRQLGDEAKRAVAELIVRILQSADRAAVFMALGHDPRSIELWERLSNELEAMAGAAPDDAAASRSGPTRRIDFPQAETAAEPPPITSRAEPPSGAEPPPSAAPPPASQPRTYRAYGLLESDETVLVGRPFELKVGLSPTSPPGVAGPPLELPKPGAEPYNLDIQLFADGFDLDPGELWRHSLIVSTADLYPSVVVHLTARALPEPRAIRSITATFTVDGATVGAATRELIVTTDPTALEPSATAATATGTNIPAPTGEPPADITITIKRGLEPGALLWAVESNLPGVGLPDDSVVESDVGREPEKFATEIIKKLLLAGKQPRVIRLLRGIGKTVQDEMPHEIRAAIAAANAAVAPRILDVLLLTEEPFIPWELAWIDEPFDPEAPQYLGAQANIGRWALDPDNTPTDPPRRVDAGTIAVVWGVYSTSALRRLKAAEAEAKTIREQYQAESIDAQPNEVFALLDGKPPHDILHFAVHGKYSPQGIDEGIYLIDGTPIDPLTVRGSNLSARAPFVFLNACQVGAGQNLLGNYAGIAQAFIEIGASAVVAPLWSVDDEIAQKIALEFYRHALQPAAAGAPATGNGDGNDQTPPTVADLLRRARAELLEKPDELSSTYLAYQLYGHPSLRLTWTPAAATGGPHA